MRVIYAIVVILFVAAACKKDKFTTKPQLKMRRVNSTEIFGNQDLVFTILLTDKEGDFSTYFGYGRNSNCKVSDFLDSNKLKIPEEFLASKNTSGDIVLTLTKIERGSNQCPGPGGTYKTDTAVFKFWTKDLAGNVSDTIWSDPIIIHAN